MPEPAGGLAHPALEISAALLYNRRAAFGLLHSAAGFATRAFPRAFGPPPLRHVVVGISFCRSPARHLSPLRPTRARILRPAVSLGGGAKLPFQASSRNL